MYAFNTGVGALKNQRISASDIARFQRNLIHSHSASTGENMPLEVVRAMMAIRVNTFARNHSGIRVASGRAACRDAQRGHYARHPGKRKRRCQRGPCTVGHHERCIAGLEQSKVTFQGAVTSARSAFEAIGPFSDLRCGSKGCDSIDQWLDGVVGVRGHRRFRRASPALTSATISLVLSLEAMRAERACFEDRVMLARPHPGQRRVAAAVRTLLNGSMRCSTEARAIPIDALAAPGDTVQPRIQDVYSFAARHRVYGPVLDALDYIDGILVTEMRIAQRTIR